ncbi:MAG: gamma-glutamyltransferase [Gammaproteobacteria bacterium]|nr:gamma-glutamyltransferase [Gammaproteobacteria bacterium]MBU6508931.1 gamma-glutamyltransferase [Gammaproteobacteria bacterium]MDE2108113.1 gamma-glutamyltransferase [Gammaproteobacteria bacterium]
MKIRLVGLLLLLLPLLVLAGPLKPGHDAVASAQPYATQAGMQVMAEGGNAFDAAVAVSAALSVVEPYSSGIGGGGFWLLHDAKTGKDVMVDGREYAPAAATATMYQDKNGNVIEGASLNGPLSAGIPGEVAALAYINQHYGKLTFAQDLAPAIKLARDGFPLDPRFHGMLVSREDKLKQWPAAWKAFYPNGVVPPTGYILKQPDLANTLESIAKHGAAAFYTGTLAREMVDAVRANGGIWSLEDLRDYQIKLRTPLSGDYRGMKIITVAPPSSGGIVMLEALNILSGFDLTHDSELMRKHLIIEAMRFAFRDRAEYLGDPDFVQMPLKRLLSPYYAAGLRAAILPGKATPSNDLAPVTPEAPESQHTTSIAVMDKNGNLVGGTFTVNFRFGSGFMPPHTGVILNDEMDDFVSKPGVPNGFGLVGNSANEIAPHKRPLSSMMPTFLYTTRGLAILGTPGGSRIISMVLLGTLDYFNGGDAQSIVSLPRYHMQYLPDTVFYEPGAFTKDEITGLGNMGYRLEETRPYGNMQSITWDYKGDKVTAAADPRDVGTAQVK